MMRILRKTARWTHHLSVIQELAIQAPLIDGLRTQSQAGQDLHKRISPAITTLYNLGTSLNELKELDKFKSEHIKETELVQLAEEESDAILAQLKQIESEAFDQLVPSDEDDNCSAILEVRPGTGGEEAVLFTEDMFKMYEKFAILRGWKFSILGWNLAILHIRKCIELRQHHQKPFPVHTVESGRALLVLPGMVCSASSSLRVVFIGFSVFL
uniref:Peptide chain release factor domain-containing protein n=1 Tax=Spongospora subterranea TaxID=70186 RepID=A0A0H5QM80_9EUKA|eukprot:CRZ03250.1 hypothetical protein [Spongospora subterranea]